MKYRHVFAIPAYGDSPWLEDCIRSLKRQSGQSHVILCTSTPSPYISGLAEKYEIPLYIREGESGIADDWNFAWEMADGELVTIAHQDDVYHRDYSAAAVEAMEKWPDMTVFTSDYVILKGKKVITGDTMLWVKRLLRLPLRWRFMSHRTWIKKLPLIFGNSICCPATTYRKGVLGEPFVRSEFQFALDWENMVKLAEREGRWICEERPLLYYRVHDGAATKACMEDHRREAEEREMFRRFWPEPVVRLLMKEYGKAGREYD